MDVEAIARTADRLRANIEKVMVGKGEVIELALTALLCHGHLLIEDVPGIGKTTLAKAVAQSLGCSFRRIQFTPDLMPSDVTGLNYFNQKIGDFELRPGPVFSQILLADEVNRATPRTQAALLEAMQERQVTIEGTTLPLPDPFLVIATQNPVELEGTFPLPEAQLDRFLLRIRLGYPSADEEGDLLLRFGGGNPLATLEAVVAAEELREMQKGVPQVRVEDSVRDYVVQVCRNTRGHSALELGASPRASLALFQTSQAWAAQHGRDYVLPDDVKHMVPFVLGHRLILTPQARLRGQMPDELLEDVMRSVRVPVESPSSTP